MYKSQAERNEEAARDPLALFPRFLLDEGFADRAELDRLKRDIDAEVAEITDRVLREPPPAKNTVLRHLYSDEVDPCSSEFDVQPQFRGEPRTMVDSINHTLAEEMRRDAGVIVFGEDVADCSREQNLARDKGQGRRLQGHSGPAARVRWFALLQHPNRGSWNHRARDRDGGARVEAGAGNSILRLHLARHDADSG